MENTQILIHKLNNVLGITGSCINRLRNAEAKTLNNRWLFMKDVIIATERDRLDREIVFYKKLKNTIEEISEETYKNVCRQLSEATEYYKAMFDILDGSHCYSEKSRDITLTNGDKLVGVLKDIISKLNDMCPPVPNSMVRSNW